MQHSKRSREGYLLMDNRLSGEGLVECSTVTCSHCHQQVMVNPLRTRPQAYCPQCDHYLCDRCDVVKRASGECRPLNQVIDELQNAAGKALTL